MATYHFNRETEALRKRILEGSPKGPAFEAPPVLNVKADDGTTIPIPYQLLGDTAQIVVTTPSHLSVGTNKTYVVTIDNRKGSALEGMLKKFGVKQGVQKSLVKVISTVFGTSAGQAATKPVGFIVGMLTADDLGNNSASYFNVEAKTSDGKTVYLFLTGDRVI